jgi:hypothetical protein
MKAEILEALTEAANMYHELAADHWGRAACTDSTPCRYCLLLSELLGLASPTRWIRGKGKT